jgi:hypothetical protein
MKPPPGMAANMKAWQSWRSTHKNISALEHTLHGLSSLSQDPKTRLGREQAQEILAITTPWRSRQAMSDLQAKQVNHQIQAVLTPAQARKIAALRPRGGPGGPPPGGPPPGGMDGPPPGGPDGPPPGGMGAPPPNGFPPRGSQKGFRPPAFPKPKEYNPLNPATISFPPEQQHVKQELASLFSTLKQAK